MREIKFRAWIKKEATQADTGLMILSGDNSDFMMVSNGDGFSVVVGHEEWLDSNMVVFMQYTGLKDKNGKGTEMCQGDLVRASGHGIGEVDKNTWGEWVLVFKDSVETIHDLMMEQDLGEIVGTKYENPELLEVVK